MLRILHVNMSLDPVTGGGTVERVRQLHAAMQEMEGVSSRILSVAIGVARPSEDIVLLPSWGQRWYLPAPRILTILREVQGADVVILMNHWTILNTIVYGLVRFCKKPYIACPAGALPVFGRSKLLKRFYNAVIGRTLLTQADAVISIAEEETYVLQRQGVESKRIHHIPNGVRREDFSYSDKALFRQYVGLRSAEEYLLFVGRLNSIKGPDLLLEAFLVVANHYPKLNLVFVGPDGGLQQSLMQIATAAGMMDRIHFPGYASGELKSSAYHGASLLVVPSRQEAMSIVALEAAVCGTPVIMTQCCGFDELAEAEGAVLVEPKSASIAEAIRTLIDDPVLRHEMGHKGQALAIQKYTWSTAAERHIKICHTLLKGRKL